MCCNPLLETIETAVGNRLRSREMFTVYDITREVRAQNYYLPHDIARIACHALYELGQMGPDYTRTLCDVGGANGPAFVFHHVADDPNGYAEFARMIVASQPLASIIRQLDYAGTAAF
jgi:hypothetical protein